LTCHILKIIKDIIDEFDEKILYDIENNNFIIDDIYNICLYFPYNKLSNIFIDLYKYLNNYKNFIRNDNDKKKYILLKDFIDEYYKKQSIEFMKNNVVYTTFYYSYNFKETDLFLNKNQWENYYDIYIEKDYWTNYIINKNILCLFENNETEIVFILFDNYTHNYSSLFKTLSNLKQNYKIRIITTTHIINTNIFTNHISIIKSKYRLNVEIIDKKLTFQDFINMLYDLDFWNMFQSKYIVLLNSLTIINNDCIDDYIKNNNIDNNINFNFNIIEISKIMSSIKNNNLNCFNNNIIKNSYDIKEKYNFIEVIDDFNNLVNILNMINILN